MLNEKKEDLMREIIFTLREACKTYYTGDDEPTMTNKNYDELLVKLASLEKETGIKLPGSPTRSVGFEEDEEDKIEHYKPILSLKDTKDIDELQRFLGENEGLLSYKLDGISIVLYYSNGYLQRAVSRGDGHFGKDITMNVILIKNVPLKISLRQDIIIRGEGVLALKDFEIIKKTKEGEKFSNPRNLAAGLINASKTSSILLQRLEFIAHSIVYCDKSVYLREEQLKYLEKLNFKVVLHSKVLNFELPQMIQKYTDELQSYDYPCDGLVLSINDILYGESLGSTSKYPKDIMAFKWPDEIIFTKVVGMKWSVSKTGLITPVVLLDPVWLEGTEVRQANLHSLKIFEKFDIGIGDIVKIYKANKIIPELEENITRSGTEHYPTKCPECEAETYILETDKTKKLYCKRDMPWKCNE